ncbi:peptidoglycan-binding domain-containing protein [Actibacterium pelagium]|uniref:Peptidoglycan-binding protein n=1 Tax=Actibacterium pelagium TaxID=2029103 RepID=A0A917AHP8_9RHOB|nr:peptidoglycan-binding protein [Actibacterium pelagium]GGE52314.1 peptidoglycan-binding protein [Actibacterium pelagium]
MRNFLTTTALALSLAGPVVAADVALVIGNSAYRELPRNPRGDRVVSPARELRDLGVRVIDGRNLRASPLDDSFADLVKVLSDRPGPHRVAVILSGQFAETANDSYFLPIDAKDDIDLASVRDEGLPLSAVLAVLADYPGEALLLLGEGRDSGDLGPFLSYGITLPDVPQGVTVLQGPASDIADFVQEVLTEGDAPTVEAAEVDHGLIASGYMPAGRVFFGTSAPVAAPTAPPVISTPAPVVNINEPALWETTRKADTVAAYRNYLDAFPEGPNAATARAMIKEIETEPFRAERLAEQDLRLSRDAKRSIQRNLNLLDYDPRGIDGLFGPGSRRAIQSWQRDNRFPATSYLTGNQIALLNSQAERRAAELEEEARQRQEQRDREDRAYWEKTGALGDAPGLRAYLNRYPDGQFAEVAQERLRVIEEAARAEADRRESIAWEQASQINTVEGYQAFINDFPGGRLAEEAQARIDAMTRDPAEVAAEERARQIEENLNLSRRTRTVVEDRLAKMGLKPGKVDGEFTDETRRAIRRYQDARNMEVTGYLNQQTIVRLMADSLFR